MYCDKYRYRYSTKIVHFIVTQLEREKAERKRRLEVEIDFAPEVRTVLYFIHQGGTGYPISDRRPDMIAGYSAG